MHALKTRKHSPPVRRLLERGDVGLSRFNELGTEVSVRHFEC
jgi:hypothetical protein